MSSHLEARREVGGLGSPCLGGGSRGYRLEGRGRMIGRL